MTNNTYRCSACRQIYRRHSEKRWIASYCSKTGKNARLVMVWSKAELTRAKERAEKWMEKWGETQ